MVGVCVVTSEEKVDIFIIVDAFIVLKVEYVQCGHVAPEELLLAERLHSIIARV